MLVPQLTLCSRALTAPAYIAPSGRSMVSLDVHKKIWPLVSQQVNEEGGTLPRVRSGMLRSVGHCGTF